MNFFASEKRPNTAIAINDDGDIGKNTLSNCKIDKKEKKSRGSRTVFNKNTMPERIKLMDTHTHAPQ